MFLYSSSMSPVIMQKEVKTPKDKALMASQSTT